MTNSSLSENKQTASTLSHWVIRLITLAFISQVYLSLNLWFPIDRSYPIIPLWSSLDFELGKTLTFIISGLFLGSLVLASTPLKLQKKALTAALFLFLILVLEDINRFQAWSYIYIALLAIICWDLWKNQASKTWISLQFIMAMVYFWTGVQKLNIQFIHDVYPWLVKVFESTKVLANYPNLGYGVGLFELLIGVLLLVPKRQKIALFLGIFLHLGILTILIKDNWNTVVYPWNVAMIFLLLVLFRKEHPSLINNEKKRPLPNLAILFLFGIIPVLDFVHLAPHCLALGMYSGTSVECDLIIDDTGKAACVPEKLHDKLLFQSDHQSILSLDDWGGDNLNIPPFASERVYRAVAKKFCSCSVHHGGYVKFYYPQRWENKDKIVRINCDDL